MKLFQIALVLLLLATSMLIAQSGVHGCVDVFYYEPDGQSKVIPCHDMTVVLADHSGDISIIETQTDSLGNYSFTVKSGIYSIMFFFENNDGVSIPIFIPEEDYVTVNITFINGSQKIKLKNKSYRKSAYP